MLSLQQSNVTPEPPVASELQPFSEPPGNPSIHISKKLFIIVGGISVLLLLFVVVFIMGMQGRNSKENTTVQRGTIQPEQAVDSKRSFNPLISHDEVDRVEKASDEMYEKAGKKPPADTYKFKYELDPSLKKPQSFLFLRKAYAASLCNIETAPETVKVYTLQSDLDIGAAKAYAEDFGLSSEPASVPNGSSYKYYFSDQATDSYLTIQQPSGMYYFHSPKPAPDTDPTINLSRAKTIAAEQATKYDLNDDASEVNAEFSSEHEKFIITYQKNYGSIKLVDQERIGFLGIDGVLCDVDTAHLVNTTDYIIGKKGEIFKIDNKIRKVTGTYDVKRQSLEQSLAEYEETEPPVKPIVIGTVDPLAEVTITDAVLVLYDYGEEYGQKAYVPMYLTSASVGSARVFTLFPAISKSELDKTPISKLVESKRSLQLEPFYPPPPPPKSGDGKCWGKQVDYSVSCSVNAQVVCSKFYGLPSEENDPFGVCQNGCQNKEGVLDVAAGTNPCDEYLKSHGLSPDKGMQHGNPGNSSFPGGTVTCKLNACPC